MLDLDIELFFDREKEIPAVALELKGEQIVCEETGQDVRRPRTDPESIRVGPWDVPEERRSRVRKPRPQSRRNKSEVIVLDEDRRVGRSDFFADRRGES